MTEPLWDPDPPDNPARKNWLLRYIGVQQKYHAAIETALKDAADDADIRLGRLAGSNVGAEVARSQVRAARQSIRDTLKVLFGNVKGHISDGQSAAAVAATEAGLKDDDRILKRLFPERNKREQYKDQMRSTAARNVQNMLGRVLGESYVPLSRQVYRTQALANGQVDRIINSHLARGASWSELAKSVRGTIRPDTPGGVGYAAKRLGRTEINNAYHAQSIADVQDKPWVDYVVWKLSKVHQEQGCVCEEYARLGKFQKERIPKKPHPQCMCYTVPALADWDEFEMQLLAGNYDQYIREHL